MKVRITLNSYLLSNGIVLKAARTAFGDGFVDRYKYSNQDVDLIATAEQLVAFQVARDKLGGENLWKTMRVEILDPRPVPQRIVVDVRPLCSR